MGNSAIEALSYPNVSGPVYSGPDHGVNLRRRVLHSGQDMAVEVERNPDARMAEAFLSHLGMNAAGEKMRRMGVTKIVEANLWQG